jgi:hypothetical protein
LLVGFLFGVFGVGTKIVDSLEIGRERGRERDWPYSGGRDRGLTVISCCDA